MREVNNGPFGKASPSWYQRLTTMAWKDTLKHYNPFSLFLLSSVTIVGLAVVNEWIVDKAGTALSGTKSKAFDSMVERKLPTYKPEYIERWEKEYGNKK